MRRSERGATYSDLLDAVWVLRNSAYGKPLAYFVSLVGGYLLECDLRRMLGYLVRRGKLNRRGEGKDARYTLRGPEDGDRIVTLKIEKSRTPWRNEWSVFTYDVPTTHNTTRHRLVRWLHEMGFATLGASSWVSPYNWREFLHGRLSGPQHKGRFYYLESAFVTSLGKQHEEHLADLWDVEDVARQYRQSAKQCIGAPGGKGLRQQQTRARALLAATRQLALVEREDPMLPAQFLSADWPRALALRSRESLRAAVQEAVQDAARSRR